MKHEAVRLRASRGSAVTATVSLVSGSDNRLHNQPADESPGIRYEPPTHTPSEGAETRGKRRRLPPDPCAPRGPASDGFASRRLTQRPPGRSSHLPARPLSRGARLPSPTTLPSPGGHQVGAGARADDSRRRALFSHLLRTRPGRPPPPSPRLTCSADTAPLPAPLPQLLPARPLLSAIFAACGASGAQRSPVRHFRPQGFRPLAPAPPPPGRSPVAPLRVVPAVSSCRARSPSRRPPAGLCGAAEAPARRGRGRVNGRAGRGGGNRAR